MIFQILAIAILLLFYGCYFAKMLSQRSRGIRTDQLGRGKTGFVLWIEVSLKAVSILVPLLEAVSVFTCEAAAPLWLQIAGVVLGFAGVGVFAAAVLQMRDNWRAGVSEEEKTQLVTDGIYRFSRNPAFLGFDLVYIGILMLFFNWILFAVTLAAMLLFHLQIVNVEEDFLLFTFGEDYLAYRKKVCRYLGRRLR